MTISKRTGKPLRTKRIIRNGRTVDVEVDDFGSVLEDVVSSATSSHSSYSAPSDSSDSCGSSGGGGGGGD